MSEALADFSRRARARLVGGGRARRLRPALSVPRRTARSLPVIGDFVPTTGSMVVMLILTMMALGLNIVVGYAGLLDLGYVAFYAAGAYVAAWFASLHFDQVTIHIGSAVSGDLPGIHLSMWLVFIAPASSRPVVGILIGLPTLRLRGDYLAIVTLGFGEIVPQFVRNADSLGGFDLTNGTFGITPIDSLAIGGVVFREEYEQGRTWPSLLLDRARAGPLHRVLLHPPARLAARPGLDRDPRGRDGGRGHGRPADADEDLVVRDRRVLRRHRGRVLRELPAGAFPADFYFQFSVFLLCMVILGGMGSIWGVIVGRMILAYLEPRGPSDDRVEDPGRGSRVRPRRSTSSGSTGPSSW